MNARAQMTEYYLFIRLNEENNLVFFSLVIQEAENLGVLGSTFIIKSKEKNFTYRIKWFVELTVVPVCCAESLITGTIVSERGAMIALDWWLLWGDKSKVSKWYIDADAQLSEYCGCVCWAHVLLAVHLEALHVEGAIV